jgi:hypothetical protein
MNSGTNRMDAGALAAGIRARMNARGFSGIQSWCA